MSALCLRCAPAASLVAQRLKHLPEMRETQIRSLGQEDPLEKEVATHSSILAWRIPWREEPGRLQSMGSQRVRHDWATSLSLSFLSCHLGGSLWPMFQWEEWLRLMNPVIQFYFWLLLTLFIFFLRQSFPLSENLSSPLIFLVTLGDQT